MTNFQNSDLQTIDLCALDIVIGGDLQGFIDGAKRIGDTMVKASGYGAAGGGLIGAVAGSFIPGAGTVAGAGAGAAIGGAGGAAFGLGWGIGREIAQAQTHTGPYAPAH